MNTKNFINLTESLLNETESRKFKEQITNKLSDDIAALIPEYNDQAEEKIEREDHIKNVEQKVEGVVKFRWIIVGAFAVIMFLFSNQSVVFDILTTDKEQGRIEIVK